MAWFTANPGAPAAGTANLNGDPGRPMTAAAPGGVLGWLRRRFGGWPGPDAGKGTDAARGLEQEKVRGGPSGFLLPAFLPYFDDQTGETPEHRQAYRQMFSDANVKAALLGKILGVASLDLQVLPADKKDPEAKRHAEFAQWTFTRRLKGGVPELAWSVLAHACLDGFSLCERVLRPHTQGKWAGKVALVQLKPKDTYRDLVLELDEFRNVAQIRGLRYNSGDLFDPANFTLYSHLPFYAAPTGTSDLRAAYRPYWMLSTVMTLRASALEKRSLPFLVGTYPRGGEGPIKSTLEDMLSKVKDRNWASVPEGVKLEAVNIAGSADAIFDSACEQLIEQIFLAIAGATLQALTGGQGAQRGSSKIHQDTASLFVWHLSQALLMVLNDLDNGLIKDLCDLNFVCAEYPHATLAAVDPQELQAELMIDNGLHQMGFKLSVEELSERYGRTQATEPGDQLPAPPGGQQPGGGGGAPPGLGLGGGGGAFAERRPADPGTVLARYSDRLVRRYGPDVAAGVVRAAAALLGPAESKEQVRP